MLRRGAAHLNICSVCQIKFRKVQRTEIAFVKGYGATHLKDYACSFSTNIEVRCTLCVTSVNNKEKMLKCKELKLKCKELKLKCKELKLKCKELKLKCKELKQKYK